MVGSVRASSIIRGSEEAGRQGQRSGTLSPRNRSLLGVTVKTDKKGLEQAVQKW